LHPSHPPFPQTVVAGSGTMALRTKQSAPLGQPMHIDASHQSQQCTHAPTPRAASRCSSVSVWHKRFEPLEHRFKVEKAMHAHLIVPRPVTAALLVALCAALAYLDANCFRRLLMLRVA